MGRYKKWVSDGEQLTIIFAPTEKELKTLKRKQKKNLSVKAWWLK